MLRPFSVIAPIVLCVLAGGCTEPSARAKSADELAKEGYWGAPDEWNQHAQLLNKPAPRLELADWIGGREVTSADRAGKIVLVDFWATWCEPCHKAIPRINEIARRYAGKGVVVIGACGGGGEEQMSQVAAQLKMEYPTAKAGEATDKRWGVLWRPHYVIVDRKGNIRAAAIKPEYIEKVIDALIREQGEVGQRARHNE
jgi:thiol-disulfide isomerase/thioredoxin